MVPYGRAIPLEKRQDPIPTNVAGIATAVTTVDTTIAGTASSLTFDSDASAGTATAPPLGVTDTSMSLITSNPTPTPTQSSQSSTPTAVAAAATKPIAMSTVIGTCIGAFIGATAFIVFGLWFYRRYARSLKSRANSRGPLVHTRNLHGNEQRRRSRLELWDKLDDGDDKWEDLYQTTERKAADQVAPMEKLTMFKKTPSVRTAYTHTTHKSTDVSAFDFPRSYAEFDPKLAETLSFGKAQMPEPRPFLGRVDTPPVSSVDTETIGKGSSYLSVRERLGGAMSPTLHMAIPTPPLTVSQAHKWESAEVVHYSEAQSAELVDPFASQNDIDTESRKSAHNPFFNAQDYEPRTRSRSNSASKSPKAKGKERMRYSNVGSAVDPFDDINQHMPRPTFLKHIVTESSSSTESQERALHSLIAALEISEEDARDRLRIASMQPSLISQTFLTGGYEEDVMEEFPLPPAEAKGF